ncbi:MAG: penicillin acylase family protein [Polyangiaceae bacterium]|nr:penicillin acylase family protein [Polyangiaceae bacterium]
MSPDGERRLRRFARSLFRVALGRRLPKLDGTVTLRGVSDRVTIHRDSFGIPHIRAKNDHDVFFAQGFCHGQDRAGQLELTVRTVRGTLSAVAGPDTLPIDRLSRRIGFRRAAEQQLACARPEVRLQLDAYVAGLREGMTTGSSSRSHEHVLLGCEPTIWEPADVQAVSALLCFALAANWDVELLRWEILRRDGTEALVALDAPYPDDLPVSVPSPSRGRTCSDMLLADLEALREVFPVQGASNAWAVDASRTATKRPMLVADPHLPPDIPVHWYLSHLATPSWRASGASFVGIPGIGLGHNDHCAWAVTAAHADNTDLFVEEIGPDRRSVREGQRFVPCEVRREVIDVKGKEPVVEEVMITARGPIVGPAFDGAGEALSMSATWLAARPYTGLHLAYRTKSREAFHDLFRDGSTSSINLVYADKDGRISWRLGVEVPVRTSGHGTLPRAGWRDDARWKDQLVPFEKMPFVDDPANGIVVSANNAPTAVGDDDPYLGVDFLDGYRQKAIEDALSARRDWTLADMQVLQKDTRSIPWEQVRSAVLAIEPKSDDAKTAHALLSTWDGRMTVDSIGATAWALFSCAMMARVVRAKAPQTAGRALGAGFHMALPNNTMITRRMSHLCKLVREQPDGFFAEGWPAAIERALGEAARGIVRARGSDRAQWSWGSARPLRLHHPMGKTVSALDLALGEGPVSFAGDASTIHQATVDLVEPLGNPLGVPNLRIAIDVGAWENSRFSLLAGQSGNAMSPHHFDHHAAWRTDGLPIAWTEEAAKASARHTLELVPSSRNT